MHEKRRSFAESYEPVASALRAWSVLQCRGLDDVLDADDLVQETCLEAFRSFEGFDADRGSFRAWLFGVATRTASSMLRRTVRRRGLARMEPVADGSSEPPALVTTISRRVRRDESLQRFLAEADRLEAEERDLLMHRGLEGMPFGEIATLLDLSVDVVSKRWQRLRTRLQALPAARDLLEDS